ncbi:calcium-binding EF hand family protein [Abeliophyllum distichum]|uniref:Calcium-binding EF hand family protein n=1 Tax=Abeliophyllum distichum TaxID=126358 RepID=A0ABD1NUU3_9LAMI
MSEGGLTILDGTQLRSVELSLPPVEGSGLITGAEVLELAESRASLALHGLALPESIKSAAFQRLGVSDGAAFRTTEFDYAKAQSILQTYVSAISNELKDDPIVLAILDGRTLRIFLEDEDDFAMLAENIFTDLDTEDRGKISKNEIKNALIRMGLEMGIPPLSEFPQLNDILKRHGAEEKEELGQAQFAQLLQSVLQELADALAKKHIVMVQNIKIVNGSKLRKLLADENQLGGVLKKILLEKKDDKNEKRIITTIRLCLEKRGKDLGLPPSKVDETETLFDEVFTEIESKNTDAEPEKDEFMVLLKEILEKFAEKLEANPVLYDAVD